MREHPPMINRTLLGWLAPLIWGLTLGLGIPLEAQEPPVSPADSTGPTELSRQTGSISQQEPTNQLEQSGEPAGPTYDLTPKLQPGQLTAVRAKMQVNGYLKVLVNQEVRSADLKVEADFNYHERRHLRPSEPPLNLQSLRVYQTATATISVGSGQTSTQLRPQRTAIIVENHPEGMYLLSPAGPLTREELDLIDIPACSLLVDSLLPQQPVAVNQTWKVESDLWARLLRFDAVGQSNVTLQLAQVANGRAIIEGEGALGAAIGGVSTQVQLRLRAYYDIAAGRITHLGLGLTEDRSIGHVAPGLAVAATLQLVLQPIPRSSLLTEELVEQLSLPGEDLQQRLRLSHQAPGGGSFQTGRNWHTLTEEYDRMMLRLVDNGELVAQCNLQVASRRQTGQKPSEQEFRLGVRQALGQAFQKFVEVGKATGGDDAHIWRAVVHGQAAELPIQWIYYVITAQDGRELVLTFTLEQHLAERFGKRDWKIIESLQFLPEEAPSSKKPANKEL